MRSYQLTFPWSYYILIAMTIQQIYDLALQMGIDADPRGRKRVEALLAKAKKKFADLPEKKKKYVDPEDLNNPYSDSRLLNGQTNTEVKAVLTGIDLSTGEVVLADRLNEKGKDIGLLISHHPDSHALASLHDVMDLQIDMFEISGIPVTTAYALFQERKGIVQRRFGPANHNQTVDAAKLLNFPYMSLHTIWDNLGDKFIKEYLQNRTFDTVGEMLDSICEIPEFIEAIKGKNGPALVSGSMDAPLGKVAVSFTGGTNASTELYIEMAKAGIGTLVEMHVPEDALKELKKRHINVIDCGHMAADSIGANIFLDELEKKGVEIIPCSGLIRVKRV